MVQIWFTSISSHLWVADLMLRVAALGAGGTCNWQVLREVWGYDFGRDHGIPLFLPHALLHVPQPPWEPHQSWTDTDVIPWTSRTVTPTWIFCYRNRKQKTSGISRINISVIGLFWKLLNHYPFGLCFIPILTNPFWDSDERAVKPALPCSSTCD